MKQVTKLTNQFCLVICQIERNGIKIDTKELNRIEVEYTKRHKKLTKELEILSSRAVGAKAVNLNSPTQMSQLIYSWEFKSKDAKKLWKSTFNLGKDLRPHIPKQAKFNIEVRSMMRVAHKTKQVKCDVCEGKGKIKKYTKTGRLYKKLPNCKDCEGCGYQYPELKPIAGFKQIPLPEDVTANGFTTKKEVLLKLVETAEGDAKEFLTKLVEYNAISVYLSSFVGGIKRGIRSNDILHPSLLQHSTATGRLSSRDPNFQNQPRGDTFPIRRVVVSRWKGGKITEGDYSGLEFRCAVDMAQDKQGIQDILDGADQHQICADFHGCSRQDAKPHTFGPLYGKITPYTEVFYNRFEGIEMWHTRLMDTALATGEIVIPSGRIYKFPYVKRMKNGNVTNHTKIKNYPVQGLATADIVPLAVIMIYNEFKKLKLKSLLINTVHDSVVIDTHPTEIKLVPEILHRVMPSVVDEVEKRFGYRFTVPLDIEVKMGANWLDTKVILDERV